MTHTRKRRGGMMGRRRALLLSLLLLLVVSSLAYGSSVSIEPITGVVTVESRFTLPEDPKASGFVAAIPAGLSDPSSAVPTALAIVWAESEASFFPTWGFSLHSDQGVLPTETRYRVQASRLFGTEYVTLQTAQPKWGHTYESALSYDPESGGLSIWIRNATTGEEVLRELLTVSPADGAFTPMAGFVDERARAAGGLADAFIPLDSVTAQAIYIPRAVKWGITTFEDGRPGSTTLSRLDRDASEAVGLRLQLPGGDDGTFRLSLVESPGITEAAPEGRPLVEVASVAGDNFFVLPWDQLPPGPITLALEYEKDGELWFQEHTPLSVGRVDASVSEIAFSQSAGRAEGILKLSGDGPFPEIGVTVQAELSEMVWDGSVGRYKEVPVRSTTIFDGSVTLSTSPIEVPITISNPKDEPALWRTRILVEVDNQVSTIHFNNNRLFGTYRRPEPITEGPFTIAAIPDPQYYSYANSRGGHPDIYVRQMVWLAENAVDEKIGLTLVLGDVTDKNAPSQWEVARESIGLLEGVVPYVVTIGNHDMGPGGNASTRDTLYNHYFTRPPADDRLTFGGSYRPGELENSYYFVTLGETEFLIMTLEFLPRDEILEWANGIAAAHPDQTIIVITHYYTARSGAVASGYGSYEIQNGPPGYVNSGAEVWQKFARKHPNILLVLSGHIHHDAMPRQTNRGDHGNYVHNLLIDYQGSPNGGNGWLALLRFFPDQERIGVGVYSPFLDEYKYDTTAGYTVPFCIDLKLNRFVPADEACAVTLK